MKAFIDGGASNDIDLTVLTSDVKLFGWKSAIAMVKHDAMGRRYIPSAEELKRFEDARKKAHITFKDDNSS